MLAYTKRYASSYVVASQSRFTLLLEYDCSTPDPCYSVLGHQPHSIVKSVSFESFARHSDIPCTITVSDHFGCLADNWPLIKLFCYEMSRCADKFHTRIKSLPVWVGPFE